MLISTLNIQNKFTYPFYVFTQIYYFFNTLLLNKNFKYHKDHLFINVKKMGCYSLRIWVAFILTNHMNGLITNKIKYEKGLLESSINGSPTRC